MREAAILAWRHQAGEPSCVCYTTHYCESFTARSALYVASQQWYQSEHGHSNAHASSHPRSPSCSRDSGYAALCGVLSAPISRDIVILWLQYPFLRETSPGDPKIQETQRGPETLRPLILPQKKAITHLTACILKFYLLLRPMKWRTKLSQCPKRLKSSRFLSS